MKPAKPFPVSVAAAALEAAGSIMTGSYRTDARTTATHVVRLAFAIMDEYAAEEAKRAEPPVAD